MKSLLMRSIERYLALCIGAFSIYLGYSLFIKLAEFSEALSKSEGKFEVAGIKIGLSHVGPGIFFALFGAVVVWLAVRMQMSYVRREVPDATGEIAENPQIDQSGTLNPSGASVAFTYLGATEKVADHEAIEAARGRLLRDFRAIDKVSNTLSKAKKDTPVSMSQDDRMDFIISVPRIKEALMFTVWDSDWGDYAEFSAWLRGNRKSPPPKELGAPVRFYEGK